MVCKANQIHLQRNKSNLGKKTVKSTQIWGYICFVIFVYLFHKSFAGIYLSDPYIAEIRV